MIYNTLNNKKNKLSVLELCNIADVSRSGYYNWIKNKPNRDLKDLNDALDFAYIKKAYDYKTYKKGAKQIKMRLKRDYGIVMNLKKIRRLMKKYGLICPIRKANPIKKILKAQQSNKTYSNILSRNFSQGKAKKTLLTDITYITYGKYKRAYLSVIKDSSTKKILAWQLSLTLQLDFVINTVKLLLDTYKGELDMDVMIHSDQGCHYTSITYQELLKENGIIQSMSRRGNCWDNAPQESFFAIMKTEMDLDYYHTYEQLVNGLIDYINYYNYDRPQVGLNELTPQEYEEYLESKTRKYLPITYLPQVIELPSSLTFS